MHHLILFKAANTLLHIKTLGFGVRYEKCVKKTWRLIIRRHPQSSCAATLGSLLDLLKLCLERLPMSSMTSGNVMLMRLLLQCNYYFPLRIKGVYSVRRTYPMALTLP